MLPHFTPDQMDEHHHHRMDDPKDKSQMVKHNGNIHAVENINVTEDIEQPATIKYHRHH